MPKDEGQRMVKPLFVFFVLSYSLTWILLIPRLLSANAPALFETLAAYGPTLAAILVTGIYGGLSGIRSMLGQLKIWRIEFKWYLFILLWPAAVNFLAIGLNALVFGGTPAFDRLPVYNFIGQNHNINPLYLWPLFFAVQGLVLLGEEIGWRGYALPKLLILKNWWVSSLILGFLWSIWHLPLFYVQGSTQSGIPFAWYLLDILAASVVFTWVYINTRKSLLIAVLFHAAINTWVVFLPVFPAAAGSSVPFLLSILLKWVSAGFLLATSTRSAYSNSGGTNA